VAIAVSERVEAVQRARSNAKAAATPSSARFRVLRAMWKTNHRYDRLRAVSMTVSMAIVAAVPASGLARVDLWAGHHYVLFHPTSLRPALAGRRSLGGSAPPRSRRYSSSLGSRGVSTSAYCVSV
jgi:hypothetical protein